MKENLGNLTEIAENIHFDKFIEKAYQWNKAIFSRVIRRKAKRKQRLWLILKTIRDSKGFYDLGEPVMLSLLNINKIAAA